jgi:acyl-CoA oxidase
VARLRHVVHGGAWPDHEGARAVVRGAAGGTWEQLNALVAHLGPAERLCGEVERLAALHEWAVVADDDGTLSALVEAHAGFAGLLADAVADGRDDLRPLLRELEHGGVAGVVLAAEAGGDGAVATTAVHDPATGRFALDTPGPWARKLLPLVPATPGSRRLAIVLARLLVAGRDRGAHPFLVPLVPLGDRDGERRPGGGHEPSAGVEVAPSETAGERSSRRHAVAFAGVVLPAEALLLGDPARAALLDADAAHDPPGPPAPWAMREQTGRICRAAAAAAALRVAAAATLRSSQQAEAVVSGGGRMPQLAVRVRQRTLVGALADAYAITSLANAAKHAWEEDRGDGRSRRLRHRTAAAQALATELARDGVTACRERSGPHGGAVSERLRGLGAVLDRIAAEDGGALAPLAVVARGELTGDGYEALAPVPRPVGELDLRDPAWWTWVARTAERHSHARAVVRMRDALRTRGGDDDAAVWNEVLPDALDVARRHAVRLTIEALVDDAERLTDGSAEQMALLQLGALWYCREVDRDAAYLAGHAIVGAATFALLPDLVDHLADLVLPSLPLLLDAFALDDELLRLPAAPPAVAPVPAPTTSSPTAAHPGSARARWTLSAPAA